MAEKLFGADVTASIVTYNNQRIIFKTISSILEHTKGIRFQLYLSDNASTDATAEQVTRNFPAVRVVRNETNLGFGYGHNRIIQQVHSRYHAIINPDIMLLDDVLAQLTQYLDNHPDVAMVTPKILSEDLTEQHLPKRNPTIRYLLSGRFEHLSKAFSRWRAAYTMRDYEAKEPFDIAFCTGCFMVARTDILQRAGGFDERYFLYFEDADLTREILRYGRVMFVPQVQVVHRWERASAKNAHFFWLQIRSMLAFFKKWGLGYGRHPIKNKP